MPNMIDGVIEKLKTRIGLVAVILTTGTAILGAVFGIDGRYAKANDVDQMQKEQKQMIIKLQAHQKKLSDNSYKEQIEDKLLELRAIAKPTQAQKAIIQHYEDKLRDVTQRLNDTTDPDPQ